MEAVEQEALSFGAQSRVDACGVDIELFTAGSGPALLFLHGLDGIEGAARLLRALAEDFTVYAPSHPGFGASTRPSGCTRVDDLSYIYLDLMDALPLDRPVMIGVSFGGWVAAEILTKDPARAAHLVLGSPLGLPTGERRRQDVADIFMLPRAEVEARMQVGAAALPGDLATLSGMRLERVMRNTEAASLYGWSPYLSNPKLAQRMHRITCPTLVLWGARDAIVETPYRERYGDALPIARVETVEEAGHRLHADQPTVLAARIRDFAGR